MSTYDDYVVGKDKPFAENINDALLLSNVFDFTVPVEYPTMCKTSGWSSEGGKKKCAVALVEIVEYDGVTATSSSVTGTGTVKLNFYPNFNSFGLIYSVEWDTDEDITCDIYSENGTLILEDIPNGVITTQVSALTQLQNFQLRFNLTSATLTFFKVTMKNNEDTRYGAEVGISDVNGLQTALDSKAPNNHATSETTYGVASTSNYGHVKVDNSLSSSSSNPVENNVIKTALDGKASNNLDTAWVTGTVGTGWTGFIQASIRNGFATIKVHIETNGNWGDNKAPIGQLPLKFQPYGGICELPIKRWGTNGGENASLEVGVVGGSDYVYLLGRGWSNITSGTVFVGMVTYPVNGY